MRGFNKTTRAFWERTKHLCPLDIISFTYLSNLLHNPETSHHEMQVDRESGTG